MPYDVECVTLLTMRQSSSPACVVVSPDGLLRYWFNVSLDTSFAEVNIADLRGELPSALINTQVRETCCRCLVKFSMFTGQSCCQGFLFISFVFDVRVARHRPKCDCVRE